MAGGVNGYTDARSGFWGGGERFGMNERCIDVKFWGRYFDKTDGNVYVQLYRVCFDTGENNIMSGRMTGIRSLSERLKGFNREDQMHNHPKRHFLIFYSKTKKIDRTPS